MRKPGEQGFSLMLLTVSMFVIVGMLGLTFDVGRMFITKNELQTFADASALAGVSYLNGTQAGVTAANSVATAGPLGTTKPNGYDFDTIAITNVTTSYSTTFL
ncbi:MAG TPA: Tad domain-containing protein, partial [Bryobacteraceae bacterium]|nr:Tad domain-containing protein [Bryobacteraceae bacterium]